MRVEKAVMRVLQGLNMEFFIAQYCMSLILTKELLLLISNVPHWIGFTLRKGSVCQICFERHLEMEILQ